MRTSTMIVTLAFVTIPVLNAQEKTPKPSFGSSVSAVTVPFSVVDKKGRDVSGLAAQDFVVSEDGVEQSISGFTVETGAGRTDLILAIDVSQSMNGAASSDSTYSTTTVMDIAKKSAKQLLDTLEAGDRVALILFHDRTWYAPAPDGSLFHTDTARMRKIIDDLKPVGQTHLYEAVYVMLKGLAQADTTTHPRHQVIVLLTDGQDSGSLVSDDQVLREAEKSQATIYSIELARHKASENQWQAATRAHAFLVSLATRTNGTVQVVEQHNELRKAYETIARELTMHYRLVYSPATVKEDGRWHQIMVDLVGHAKDEWIIRHRLGYYAPNPPQKGKS